MSEESTPIQANLRPLVMVNLAEQNTVLEESLTTDLGEHLNLLSLLAPYK